MKKVNRLLCVLLALVLVAGMLPMTARAADTTIYFRNTGNWSSVNAYAWSDENVTILGGWPGSAMTSVEGDLYAITVPFGTPYIIFNNGSGAQTNDLTIPTDGNNCYDYIANAWSYYDDGSSSTGTLTITVAECVGGSVQANKATANPGDTIALTATPDSGYRFVSWDVRDGSGTAVTVTDNTFVMPQEGVTVSAVFDAIPSKTIYFKNDQNWTGTIYAYAWSGANSALLGSWPGSAMTSLGDDLYSINVPGDAVNIIFNNASSQTSDLTIPTDGKNLYTSSGWTVYATYAITATSGDETMGTVTGGGNYLHGSTVSVTATPATGYKFAGWQESGEIISTDNPYTFTAEGERTLTAVFTPFVGFTVTLPESAGGTVSGSGEYEQNTTATVTAVPAVGYVFSGWQENGEIVSTANPYSFTVTANRTLTAIFDAADTYSVTFSGSNVTLTGDSAATVGRDYIATLTAADGYIVPASITVTIGGAETTNYTYQRNSGDSASLVIPGDAITGAIAITAAGETASGHLIINRLTHITTSSDVVSVEDGTNYSTTLTADKGYKLPASITVTVGGEEVTTSSGMLAYNANTGSVTVRFIDGDVVITAVAEEADPQASLKLPGGDAVEYDWLSDALEAAQGTDGAVVTMLTDLTSITSMNIADAENLTFELNGKTLDCVKSFDALTITNSSVTIQDSSAEETGTITSINSYSGVMLNSGSLIVNSGTIGDSTGIEVVDGTLAVYGGTIYGGSQGIMMEGGEVNIHGGTICGSLTSTTGKGINVKVGVCTIYGGTIGTGKGNYGCYVQKAGELYVYDGEFLFKKSNGFYANNNAATIVINGGVYPNGIWVNRNSIAYYLGENVSVLSRIGQELDASGRSITEYAFIGTPEPGISLSGATLSLESEVRYNLYFTPVNMEAEDMGLIVWDEEPEDATLNGGGTVIEGAVQDTETGSYMVSTMGIPGKKLGDTKYLVVYAKLSDGTVVYSYVLPYSAKDYCLNRLENSTDDKLKALCVALMNYGTAAQEYFDYKTDEPMNAVFADYQALVPEYASEMMAARAVVEEAKAGDFGTASNGFTGLGATMSADGIFAINYYFTTTVAAEDVTFYYWTEEAYAAADVLTAENASGSKAMTPSGRTNQFWANVSGIAAKDLDQNIFVCAVYEKDGTTCSTGVFAYSLGRYCVGMAQSGSARSKAMAEATVVYSYCAKTYFGE